MRQDISLTEAQTPAPETDPDDAIKNYPRLLQLARAGLVPEDSLFQMTNVLKNPKRFGISPKVRNQLYDLMIKTLNYIVISDPAAWARFRQFLLGEQKVEKSKNSSIKDMLAKIIHEEVVAINPTSSVKRIKKNALVNLSLEEAKKPGDVWQSSTEDSWAGMNKNGERQYFNLVKYPNAKELASNFASGKISTEKAREMKGETEKKRAKADISSAIKSGIAKKVVGKKATQELDGPDNPEEAIGNDFKEEKKVATRIDKFAQVIMDRELAKRRGEDVGKDPKFDFCTVSIPGTNLFCDDNLEIPREKMPQLKTTATPGSKAEELLKKQMGKDFDPDKKQEVNAEAPFLEHLREKGVKIEDNAEMSPTEMKATQNELVGAKVVSMANALVRPDEVGIPKDKQAQVRKVLTAPLIVSKDGYVLDGHHRWAALTVADLLQGNGGKTKIKVIKVDMDIDDLVGESNTWGNEFGLVRKSSSQQASGEDKTKKENYKPSAGEILHESLTKSIEKILKEELSKYSMYA